MKPFLSLLLLLSITYGFPQKPKYSPVPDQSNNGGEIQRKTPQKPIYSPVPRHSRKVDGQNHRNLPNGCRYENKIIHDIEYKDEIQQECTQKFKSECETKYQTICKPYQEKVCQTDFDRQCEVKYRESCEDIEIIGEVEYEEEVCKEKIVKVCDKHWECTDSYNPKDDVEYEDDDYDCNDKIWTENPNSCQNLRKTECYPETKYKTVKKPSQKCGRTAYEDCQNVPYEKCDLVTKQDKCIDEPYQDCQQVPYSHCENIHKQVPYQKSWEKQILVCDNGNNNQDYDDYDFYDDLGNNPVKRINTRDARNFKDPVTTEDTEMLLTGKSDQKEPIIRKPKYTTGIVFPSDE